MKTFHNILVQIDSRSTTHPVLDRAILLAKSQQASLKIVDIVPELSWSLRATSKEYQELHDLLQEKKTVAVAALAEQARSQGVQAVGKVLTGKSSLQIIDEVKQAKHDLVMRDAKGMSSRRMGFLGTTVTRLMRFCPCAVWSFRPARSAGQERVVAAIDAQPLDDAHARLNRRILDLAFGLAAKRPHVLYAWTVYGEHLIKDYMKHEDYVALEQDERRQALARLTEILKPYSLSGDAPEVHLLHGSGDEEIARFVNQENFDLLVMGTVGRSGISGLLVGNTAELLLDRVECSILAVKPVGDVAPVGE